MKAVSRVKRCHQITFVRIWNLGVAMIGMYGSAVLYAKNRESKKGKVSKIETNSYPCDT